MNQINPKNLVIVTGVGIKPVNYIFKDITTGQSVHTPVIVGDTEYKANIGAAAAHELCKAGFSVCMIARTEDNLKIVKKWIERSIPSASIEYKLLDMKDRSGVDIFVSELPKDKDVHWVQCVGLGGGTVKVKDDNPYLTI